MPALIFSPDAAPAGGISQVNEMAAGRIFQSGYEVNHDTLTECLRDDLFYAELSDNQHRQKVLTLALTTLELQRGRV
ncbi:MAG: hypothetical protein ACJ8LD_23060 [Pantoea agglomerans]|uniref:hypothetical protein n=1 Tax=Enterobacter agglomerans TaxID=549 RepID=UPI0013BFDBD0|nr:hypothetical protein [Pantoea agglomerans]NEH20465.1 hypothetical protein [Pantoea agglomerans]